MRYRVNEREIAEEGIKQHLLIHSYQHFSLLSKDISLLKKLLMRGIIFTEFKNLANYFDATI